MDKITIPSKETEEQDEIPVKETTLEETPCTCPYCDYEAFYASFQANLPTGKVHPNDSPDLGHGAICKHNKHIELIRDHELLYRNIIQNVVAKEAGS